VGGRECEWGRTGRRGGQSGTRKEETKVKETKVKGKRQKQ
jgi:hypothetical protein